MTNPVEEMLLLAAEELEKSGWIQNKLFGPRGECCALGAMAWAEGEMNRRYADENDLVSRPVAGTMATAIMILNHKLNQPLDSWNDQNGRTKEEVIALFRETAEELKING